MKKGFKRIIPLFLVLTMIVTSLVSVTAVSAAEPDLSKDYVKTFTESGTKTQAPDSLIRTKAGEDTAYMLRNSNDFSGRNSAFVDTDGADYGTTLFDGSTGNSMYIAKHSSASSDTTDASVAVYGTSLGTSEASGVVPRAWFDKSSLKPGDTLVVSAYARSKNADATTKFNIVLSNLNSVSKTAFTKEYGTAGMEVTSDWTKFEGTITVPDDFTTTDNYTLHFGYAQNTKMESMNVSCLYAAKAAPVDIKTTLSSTTAKPGETINAKAEILNQLGNTDGVSQDVTWYITNEARDTVITDAVSISDTGVITVSDNAEGTYFAVAVSTANSEMVSGAEFSIGEGELDLTQDFVKTFTESDSKAQAPDSLIRTKAGETAAYMLRNSNDFSGRNSAFVDTDGADYGITLFDGSTGNSTKIAKHASAASDTTDASVAVYGTSLGTSEASGAVPRAWFDKSGLKPGDKLVVSAYAKTSETDKTTKFNLVLSKWNSVSTTGFTKEYGTAGMEVTGEWKKFVGTITVPDDFTTDDAYTLHFGFAQNTKMESMNVSCLYAAKVAPVDIKTELTKASVQPGETFKANVEIFNQVGTKEGISQEAKWYVTNSDRTTVIKDSGITVSDDGTVTVSESANEGSYNLVAVATADKKLISGQPIEVKNGAVDLTKDFSSTIVMQTSTQKGSDSLIMTKAGEDTAYMLRNSNDINGRNSAFVDSDGADYGTTLYDGTTGNSMYLAKHASATSDTTDASVAVYGTSLGTSEANAVVPRAWFDKSSLKPGDKLLVSAYARTRDAGAKTNFNIVLSNLNSVSKTAFTEEYGTAGMEVTNEWTKFVGIITVPADFTTTDDYTLHFGYAQNSKLCDMNISCLYAAKVQPAKFDVTLEETSVEPGNSITVNAKIVNQAGTKNGVSNTFKWYVTNDDRTEILSDSGITVTPTANEGEATIAVSSNAQRGNYYIVAVSSTGETKGQMFEVGGIDPDMTKLELYISNDGNDSNTGSIDKPFKTFERAKDYIANFKKRDIPITVYIRGGEYTLASTLSFGAKDSGASPSAPVTYKAYNGEEVVLTASKSYDISKFAPISGDMKDYLSDDAKNNVLVAKASDIGLDPIDITITDSTFALGAPLMMIDNQAMNLSRYPNSDSNEDWLIGQPVDPKGGNNTNPVISLPNEEKLFNMSYRTEDFIYHGYIAWGWAANYFKATLNPEAKTVNGTTATYYGITSGQKKPIHVFNSFEALDQPGEWYYDKSSDLLYIYPFESTTEESKLYISTASYDLISLNGTKNFNIEGIRITSSNRSGVKLYGTDNVTINNCVINNFGNTAVNAEKSTNFTLENSNIYHTALTAIAINGGDIETMTPSGNIIKNNLIHDALKYKEFHIPAVVIRGVEPHVESNEFYNIPLAAIGFSAAGDVETSVNSVIEYNTFHECCTNAVDYAVIYGGRDFRSLGTTVRYNHFYNISNNLDAYGFSASAVFGDDATSSMTITNNIVGPGSSGLNTEAFKINWGHDNVISNNLVIDVPALFYVYKVDDFVDRIERLYDASFGSEAPPTLPMCWDNVNYQTKWPWVKAFKDGNGYYVPNTISKNILVFIDNTPHTVSGWAQFNDTYYVYNNGKPGSDEPDIEGFTTNLVIRRKNNSGNKALFADYDGGNYSLNAETLAKVEGFENIDQSKIGIKTFEYDGNTLIPGGAKPVASDVKIEGLAKVGKTISANYSYSSADGANNGTSYANFYLLEDENESFYLNYKKLSDNSGLNSYKISPECEGKWIKCKVTPVNEDGTVGEAVWSEPIYVELSGSADKDELYELIQTVKAFVDAAETGSEPGQYPESEAELIRAAVSSAEEVLGNASATQYAVDTEKANLDKAFKRFKNSQNIAENVSKINIAPFIKDAENWTFFNNNYELSETAIKIYDGYQWATLNNKFTNTELSFRYKQKVQGDAWAGFYFAQQEVSQYPWATTGVLLVLSANGAELQIRDGITACTEETGRFITNKDISFENDRTYDITAGMYDVSSSAVRIYVIVDGETIFDTTVSSDVLVSKEGYFGAIAPGGTEVTISGAKVDKSELEAVLASAKEALDNAETGTDYNQYSAADVAKLNAAYDQANSVFADEAATSDSVNRATYALGDALEAFKKTAVTKKNFTGDGNVTINTDTDKSVFNVTEGTNATVSGAKNVELPEIESTSNGVSMNIPNGTKLNGSDWDGTFRLPTIVAEPSAKPGSVTVQKVYAMGSATPIESDEWITIVIKGMKDTKLAYLAETGKYKTISDKAGAVPMYREADGNDAVIHTKLLTEIIAFETIGTEESGETEQPGGPTGDTVINTIGGSKGNNAFYSGDTTSPNATIQFTDMINHWAMADVMAMNKAGIVSGVTDTLFEPDRNITRAEFAAIIARALKLSDKAADYKDVSDEWFAPYVGACSDAGIISGYEGFFRPNDNITRQEMAVIIVNAYSYLEKQGANGGIDKFTDKAEIADWAKAAVDTASSVGLISGMGDGTFAPSANATRAQATSIVKRLLDK